MIELIATLTVFVVLSSLYLRYLQATHRLQVGYTLPKGRRRVGYIYFFRGKREAFWHVKIGRAVDPVARLRSHRTANPYGVHVLGVLCVANDVVAEKLIHTRFASSRISRRNEWFTLTPRLWLYILLVRNRGLTKTVNRELNREGTRVLPP